MKTNSSAEKVNQNAAPADPGAAEAAGAKVDLALKERRKLVRQIPAPEAVESDRDTDWALFQALSNTDDKDDSK